MVTSDLHRTSVTSTSVLCPRRKQSRKMYYHYTSHRQFSRTSFGNSTTMHPSLSLAIVWISSSALLYPARLTTYLKAYRGFRAKGWVICVTRESRISRDHSWCSKEETVLFYLPFSHEPLSLFFSCLALLLELFNTPQSYINLYYDSYTRSALANLCIYHSHRFPFFIQSLILHNAHIFFPTTMGSSRPPWPFHYKVYFILHFIISFPFIPRLPCQRPSTSLFWYSITVSNWYFQAFPSTLLSLFCVSNRCKTVVSYIHSVVVHTSLTTSNPEGPLLPSLFTSI